MQLPNSDKPNNQLDGYEVADGTKKDANGKQITKWIGGYAEGGKLGDIVGYKQQHIFKNWEDVKAHANMRIDEVANCMVLVLLMKSIQPQVRHMQQVQDGNLSNQEMYAGRM